MRAAGAALIGLLHAAAAGAVVLAGLRLAAPGTLDPSDALEAAAQAISLGLASLRVPLESGEVHGAFAPLSGLLLTLWGLASAARKGFRGAAGRRAGPIVATGIGFSLTCAAAAALAGSATGLDASVPGAALAGLAWGTLAAAFGLRRRRDPLDPPVAAGVLTAVVALGGAAVWFLVAVVVALVGSSARELAGGVLLAVAGAPNAAAASVVVGLGGSVDAVLAGTALADPLRESLSLFDWAGGGIAPPYVLVLVAAPLAAVVAGGRQAAAVTPAIVRGLRNGAVLGATLVAAGSVGSLEASAAGPGETVSIRLGYSALTTFALSLAWGVAGAYLGPRLGRRSPAGGGSRVSR